MTNENKVEYSTIYLPKPLIFKIKEFMKKPGFLTVSSYISYVIREIISFIEKDEKSKNKITKEEERVKLINSSI